MCCLGAVSCPIVCFHTATWWERRKRFLFTGLFVCAFLCASFSHKLVSACLAATSKVGSVYVVKPALCVCAPVCVCVCVCVWYEVSRRQSYLNPKIKGRGCPSLPLNYSVCGEGVRKHRFKCSVR